MIRVFADTGRVPNGYDTSGRRTSNRFSELGSRLYSESACRQTYDRSQWFFMDVGCWQGGVDGNPKTTFGFICGNHIALCSWLNRVEDGTEVRNVPAPYAPLPDQMRDFFSRADRLSLPNPGRGRIIAIAKARGEPLTSPNEAVAVFPDLHLHAYVDQPVDRFRYTETPGGHLTTLDPELRAAIDLCDELGITTVQVGDLYEVWEVEFLARLDYRLLLEAVDDTIGLLRRTGYERPHEHLRTPLREIVESGIVPVRDMSLDGERFWDNYQGSPSTVRREGVDFRSTDDICEKIRRAHRGLFGSSQSLFSHEIRGNHDNFFVNQYWSEIAPDVFRNNPKDVHGLLRQDTHRSRVQQKWHLNDEIGNGAIWIEHGHHYDWHNNNRYWWCRDHGFDLVYLFLIGWCSDWIGKRSESGGEFALGIADWWQDRGDQEMRLPELRRADELIAGNRGLKLIVMGHTHSPALLESGCRRGLGPTDPGWLMYRGGEIFNVYHPTNEQLQEFSRPWESERVLPI